MTGIKDALPTCSLAWMPSSALAAEMAAAVAAAAEGVAKSGTESPENPVGAEAKFEEGESFGICSLESHFEALMRLRPGLARAADREREKARYSFS